jgi:hypothetical protein
VLYYAWGEDYNDNPKKAGQLDPPRMLDLEWVKSWCGLKKMYLVACNCDASCTASLILWYGFMVEFGIFNYHWNPYIVSTFP